MFISLLYLEKHYIMEIFLLLLILAIMILLNSQLKEKVCIVYNKVFELEGKIDELKKLSLNPDSNLQEERNISAIKDPSPILPIIITDETPETSKGFSSFQTINSYEVSSFDIENEIGSEQYKEGLGLEENDLEVKDIHYQIEVEESESWYQRFTKRNPDIERFIGENLISKIGIAILVLGIAFFVQFAIDNNWINESARVGIGVLAGAIILGFAHKLQKEFKAFSSVLVSGGIAIFYFTFYTAFQDYHLFSQTVAFTLMIVVTAFSVVISLAYDRQELAALSLIGGVATPFLLSTGSGNYQVLFTYLLILDLGILVLAYFRNWNLLNLLTYVFSMLIFGVWFRQKVIYVGTGGPYLGALVFGTLFYLIFTLSNLINQIKEKRPFKAIELSLILSNTFIYFGIGITIMNIYHPELKGFFTIIFAFFNLLVTYIIHKNYKVDENLFYLLIGLTLTFITLAAPVQLKGNYITLFWAAEASLLLWLAQKSKLQIYRFVSLPIMALAIISLLMDWEDLYVQQNEMIILLNPAFLSGLFVSICIYFYRHLLTKDENKVNSFYGIDLNSDLLNRLVGFLIILTVYFSGMLELNYHINRFVDFNFQCNVILLTYHLIFSSVIFILNSKFKQLLIGQHIIYLAYSNLLVYLLIIGFFSSNELFEQMQNSNSIPWAYWIHLIAIIPFVHQMLLLYKSESVKYPKASSWLIMVLLTVLLSAEALWQRLQIGAFFWNNPILTTKYKFDEYEFMNTTMIKTGFPILWGLIAFYLLQLGIKRRKKPIRIAALSLLGLTILKLFIYDIKNASKGGKIGAFILLGVVLLVVSFTYQKIKSIILEDHKINEEAPSTN